MAKTIVFLVVIVMLLFAAMTAQSQDNATETATPPPEITSTAVSSSDVFTATPEPPAFLGILFQEDFEQGEYPGISGPGLSISSLVGNGILCLTFYEGISFGSSTWTDYSVDITTRVTLEQNGDGNGFGYIMTRLDFKSNGYRHVLSLTSSDSRVSQYYAHADFPFSSDVDLGGANMNAHSGEWHHLRAEVDGKVIRTFFDEVLVASQDSDSRSSGWAGLGKLPGSMFCIDEIVVRSLDHSDQAVANVPRGVATANVNMRSGAGTTFDRVSGLTSGEEVYIIDYNADRSWVYVRKTDTPVQGWVSADYIR